MPRRIALILPSSTYRAPDFMKAARAVDAEIVIATESEQLLTDPSQLIMIDLDSPEKSAAAIARRGPFDAIVPVDDGGVLIGALAAAQLGLPHSPPRAVAKTRDKIEMRRALAAAGVPQPAFRVVDAGDDVAAAVADVGLPAVIKPPTLSAGQGVIRVDDVADGPAIASRVRAIAAAMGRSDDRLLVEEYVEGAEVALEAMVGSGELVPLALLDKPEPLVGPYFEETIFTTPSRHPTELRQEIERTVALAVAALGLAEGPVHAELRLGSGGPLLIEIAARPIGGLCGRALEFGVFGTSLETVLVRHALRLPQSGLGPTAPATGVMMIPIPNSGRLVAVEGLDPARAVAGVTGIEITIPIGERVRALPEGNRYLGFIFGRALTPAEVEATLRRAHEQLTITIH